MPILWVEKNWHWVIKIFCKHLQISINMHARADTSCPFYGQKNLALGNSNILQTLAECFHQITNLSHTHIKLAD
jgi:hypothetical protein